MRYYSSVLAIAFTLSAAGAADPKPTGHAGRGLEFLDQIMLDTIEKHKIPGAAVAIAKDGRLVFARGYGWADIANQEPVQPTSLFNLASCSKPVTGVAILKLVDEGKLKLDGLVFKILNDVKPPEGVKVDPRYFRITVRQMLHHASGLPRDGKGREAKISLEEFVGENMRTPLEFDPGTKTEYSNLGFLILRLVVKHAAKENYEKYAIDHVLSPAGIKDMRLDSKASGYFKGEVRRYVLSKDKPLPGGQGGKFDDDGGNWAASAVDVMRFMTALNGSRGNAIITKESYKKMLSPLAAFKDRERYNGLGWDSVEARDGSYFYAKNGGIAGIATYMEHQPNGLDFTILFNSSPGRKKDAENNAAAWRKEIVDAIRKREKWPKVDFFEKFP